MHQIVVANIAIDVIRKDIKNLHLAVYPPAGRVRIAAPFRFSDEALRLFAISKLSWIKKHQRKFAGQERQTEREYVSGESHYYNGKRYILEVFYYKAKPKVVLGHKKLKLFVRESNTKHQRARVLTEWYRERLKEQIPSLIEKWEKRMEVKIHAWGIKQMKTRWGTCNARARRVWLNLELAKKSARCLEYVLVHEMVHLLERKHSERFIVLMNEFMPQWRSQKEELNRAILNYSRWKY
jgi:predicted metal-dependent hydrolase